MTTRQEALARIADIARTNGLDAKDILAYLTAEAPRTPPPAADPGIVSKIFGYMGGILVFAGIGVFISMFWDEMSAAARIGITLGSGFLVFLMAVSAAGNERYTRTATPLFLAANLLQPMGILVMLAEFSSGRDPRLGVLFMAGVMLTQQALTFIATRRPVLAFTSLFFGTSFLWALFDILEWDEGFSAAVIGTSLLCVCHAASKTPLRPVTPLWFLLGSIGVLAGIFSLIEGGPFEILYLGLCAFMIFFSTIAKSRAVLFAGTLATLCYIGYFTAEHFVNSLGWPIALIVIGVVMIALSSAALKINRKYIASP